MSADTDAVRLTGRPFPVMRWLAAVVALVLIAGGAVWLVRHGPFGVVAIAAGALVLTEFRRCVVVVDGELVVRGRFVRRVARLQDLLQVAVGPSEHAWVQVRGERAFRLCMVPRRGLRDRLGSRRFTERLRAIAEDHDARLNGWDDGRVIAPPDDVLPFFSR